MAMLDVCRDLQTILLDREATLIDVRAPLEFAKGALPHSVNLPILNDDERARVGKCYKSNGADAAAALGHKLVSGSLRESRIDAWVKATQENARYLCCWRGGLRSQLAQLWLDERGVRIERVEGGFKALRTACLTQLQHFSEIGDWLLIGGRTGSGKTQVLNRLNGAIDLEGIAHHRGSAFGAYPDGQPTPINFENALAIASLRHSSSAADAPKHRVLLEDEGSTIGRLGLPIAWHQRMQSSPLVILEVEQTARVDNIFEEYVGTETRSLALAERYDDALQRISRRLGGARSQAIRRTLADAFASGEPEAHRQWIANLLTHYYDPMYDYQIAKKEHRVALRGSVDEICAYLAIPANSS